MMKTFNEIFEDRTKIGTKVKTDEYYEKGAYLIIDQGKNLIAGYTDMKDGLFEDVPAIIFGDHTRVIKYVEEPFFLGADGVKVLRSKYDDANYKYLYYALKNAKIPDTGYNRHFKWLKEVKINYPDMKRQEEIVNVLDKVSSIIESREEELKNFDTLIKSRFVEMFGDPEENPFKWDKIPLSDVIVTANNGMTRRGNDEDGNIVMRLVELQDGYIDYSNPNRIILKDNEKKKYLLNDKDFLFARVNGNPDNVGRCAVFHDIGEEVYHNDHIIRVHFNEDLLDGIFASSLLNSDYGKRQLKSQIKTSAGQYTVSQDGIGAIVTILPPMDLQEQFADFVHQVDKLKFEVQNSLNETQLLFDSLMQKYFG